ncbi:hypothetical protein J2X69_002123 [Algoriphagus sp. 4150]|uniref:hypothetical protein n=1 Tax=Algoriphagus sp. 4150 TaxID=2817756 RepID=UPI0028584050|nr:hypothetical protein [Algoriphagus sp. 4150]MDR7129777.1 hypothetical protein [Algoriphagus sp. 4150]
MDRESLIIAYFEGTLDESEQLEFEKLLSEDPGFAEEVASRNRLKQAIRQEERAKIKRKLLAFEQEQKRPKPTIRKRFSIAAAFLLMGIVTIWWYNQEQANNKLYGKYYETFPNMVQPLVRGENGLDERTQAFRAYDEGSYREAADFLSESTDAEGLFYAALSEMELGEYDEAAAIFDSLDISGSDLEPFMLWYKALNLLQLDRKEEAIRTLTELEKDADFNLRDKVITLRRKLQD